MSNLLDVKFPVARCRLSHVIQSSLLILSVNKLDQAFCKTMVSNYRERLSTKMLPLVLVVQRAFVLIVKITKA